MKSTKLISVLLITSLLSINVLAFDSSTGKGLTLEINVSLEGSSINADSISINITEITSNKMEQFEEPSSDFDISLLSGKRYLIFMNKNGYETHFFEFSTVGMNEDTELLFYLDVSLLEDKGAFSSSLSTSSVVTYDCEINDQYVNVNPGTLFICKNSSQN